MSPIYVEALKEIDLVTYQWLVLLVRKLRLIYQAACLVDSDIEIYLHQNNFVLLNDIVFCPLQLSIQCCLLDKLLRMSVLVLTGGILCHPIKKQAKLSVKLPKILTIHIFSSSFMCPLT